ncbi:hypothetical protein FJZ31_06155 [Candidatus Poribacteria bacterium]|nr:hypothetical protein [Candidatus Poribacteria bacterium]
MFDNTDKIVSTAVGFTFFTFLINVKLDSIIIVYLNAIVILGLFGYSIWRLDGLKILCKSLVIGAIAAVTYLPIDNLLGSLKILGLITYLKHDLLLGITPLHIFLNWLCLITITLYFYQRLRRIFTKVYFPMLLTGIVAFGGSIVLSMLGNYAGLWLWNTKGFAPPPFIGSLPLFVPIGLFLTFLFSPYFVLNILVGGIRCGVALGILQFVCFSVFRYFQ